MDPATALGVAAAAVQFIEIGLKTLALCKEIRDSETDTTVLHAELQQSTKQLQTIQSGVTVDTFPRDTSRSIKQCSLDCSSAAKELQDVLSEIRAIAQKRRFGAARAAFCAMKDQKKIEKIQNKLEKCQARFQTAVSVDTREQVLSLLQAQGKLSKTLEDVVYPELKRMHDSTHEQISTVQRDSAVAHETTHRALASLNKDSRASRRAISDVGAQLQGRFDRLQTSHTRQAFLQSLEHPDMFSRHSQIDTPATGTFEWIFMRGSSRIDQDSKTMELQGRFSKWLRSSQPVFWINGKAGSGKSSLMSFIESHERTYDLLKIWASGHKLHVFSFFFWRAGSRIQNSIPGLLQSLLYQLARAKPGIIGKLISSDPSTLKCTWTEARLQRAIEEALPCFGEDRIFVLIDGLDEFSGRYTALVALLLGLQNRSHSKFCFSSRPETALEKHLGSFPSLKLQDLNYGDIKTFVRGELKSCGGFSERPWELYNMVRDVARRAEGIFLWAALVCKSLVSGFESMDDADMLRRRLDTIPSGLEALFALMFSSIDREHREHLSKCFFLLKWSRENGLHVVSDISIPAITAFLSTSPHQSLSEFVQDCRLVEHRVIAQAKGLLEIYQPKKSMFDTDEEDLQEFGLCVLSDALSGEIGYRFIRHESSEIEMYPIACDRWVHRSAYDYILGNHSEYTRSWRVPFDETKLLRRLVDAQSWLAHYFPGQHMDPYYPPSARIVTIIRGLTGEVMLAGFQALDKLHDTIEAAHSGRTCIGTDETSVIDLNIAGVFREAKPLRAFWINLVHRSQGEYLFTRFDRIQNSVYVDILCSGLINHFWYWHEFTASEAECTLPAMRLSFDHLFNRGYMGCAIISAPEIKAISRWDKQRCLSWQGNGEFHERRMVGDVVRALKKLPHFYFPSTDSKYFEKGTGSFPGAAECAQKLIELSDIWQIYCGPRLDAVEKTPCSPIYLHVPAWIYWWGYDREPYIYGVNPSDRVLPAWRFVCYGQDKKRVRQHSSSGQIPVMACFDVRAPETKQLMNQFGVVSGISSYIALRGTPGDEALCLETILEEVWADADRQFDDGWQQLYMLTCLKKHFGDMWNVPEVDLDSEFGSDSDYGDQS